MQKKYVPNFSKAVYEEYLKSLDSSRMCPPLRSGESPSCFNLTESKLIPADFFENPEPLPKVLKQFPKECDQAYEKRLTEELCLHISVF